MNVRDLDAEYKISFDKFFFVDQERGIYSEYFHELEIECDSEFIDPAGLGKISQLISSLVGLTSHKSSKHFRAMAWLSDPKAKVPHEMVVAFEILDFHRLDDISQQQALLLLNKCVKDNLQRKYKELVELDYLPTGSGFVVVINDDQKKEIAPALVELKMENKLPSNTGLAIGYGPLFRYSDFNERVNYGGLLLLNTINEARSLSGDGISISPSATSHMISQENKYQAIVGRLK